MNTFCAILLLLAVTVAGCTTKSRAKADARAAFFAGQAKAMQVNRSPRAAGNTVAILGPVNFPALTWTPDLTLAKCIFAAEYNAPGEPTQITVTRNGELIPVSPTTLINGEDIPLLPGDVVELKP